MPAVSGTFFRDPRSSRFTGELVGVMGNVAFSSTVATSYDAVRPMAVNRRAHHSRLGRVR